MRRLAVGDHELVQLVLVGRAPELDETRWPQEVFRGQAQIAKAEVRERYEQALSVLLGRFDPEVKVFREAGLFQGRGPDLAVDAAPGSGRELALAERAGGAGRPVEEGGVRLRSPLGGLGCLRIYRRPDSTKLR